MKFDLDVTSDSSKDTSSREPGQTSTDCIPLLEAANLNIYRENPFRITGLPVDATTKEITRHADKLKQMEELGYGQMANTAAFALDPPPTVDELRKAIQRLKEPERRLIDEFFWFWPKTFGESANDPAIQALREGDMSKAYEIWESEEGATATGFVANHNIAVMLHLVALDWTLYHLNAEVDAAGEGKIRGYWKDSFKRWEKIPSDDRLWDALKARIRSVNDPRLTTGFGRRLADTLPNALDKINAEAGLKFAEQGRLEWARAHIEFMRETHQGLDNVAKTVEMVLTPLRKRVRQHIQTARETTEKDPKKGGEAARLLIDECTRLHFLYDLFHFKDAHQKTELFDEVAAMSTTCVVSHQQATGDDRLFVEILRLTMSLATASEIRERIQRNLEIGESNLRREALEPVYDKIKAIQDSKLSARARLDQTKPLISELARLVETDGSDSQRSVELADSLAILLRAISVSAYNDQTDLTTALEAITIAQKVARDTQLRSRINEDINTLNENKKVFQAAASRKKKEEAGRNAVIVCVVLGVIIGVIGAGAGGAFVGGFLGFIVGSVISGIMNGS